MIFIMLFYYKSKAFFHPSQVAAVGEAAVEVHIQVEVGQGREALEDPEDSVDPVSNQQKVRKAKPFQH